MEFLYCEGMSNAQPSMNCFKVKPETKIEKGDIVALDSNGYLVKADYGMSIGVAAEDHPANAVSDLMPVRDSVKVITSECAVYRAYGIKMQFKEGSTETCLHPASFDWTNGAYDGTLLILVSKAESSENTDTVGTVRKVSSSYQEGDGYIMNVSEGGIPHPDDVYALLPQIGERCLQAGYGNDEFSFTTENGQLRCVGHDLSLENTAGLPSCLLKLNKHVSTDTLTNY